MQKFKNVILTSATLLMCGMGATVMAYDGTNCKAPGNCWEAKPGFPAKIEGSKYDPKHSQAELDKQTTAMAAMEERNAKRVENFKKTGKWNY